MAVTPFGCWGFGMPGGWITIDPGAVLQCSQPGQANPTAGITNNGAWVVSRTGATTISVPIRGSGSVTNIGTGALTLGATNTYTGSTVILAGSLNLSTSKALGGGNLIIDDSLAEVYKLSNRTSNRVGNVF